MLKRLRYWIAENVLRVKIQPVGVQFVLNCNQVDAQFRNKVGSPAAWSLTAEGGPQECESESIE